MATDPTDISSVSPFAATISKRTFKIHYKGEQRSYKCCDSLALHLSVSLHLLYTPTKALSVNSRFVTRPPRIGNSCPSISRNQNTY